MMCNYVLSSTYAVSSVKSKALELTFKIFDESSKYNNIDIIRIAINMCKSNYMADNSSKVQDFLERLFTKISNEELSLMINYVLEFEPYPLELFLTALWNINKPLVKVRWIITKLWMCQMNEGWIQEITNQIWNKHCFNIDLIHKQSASLKDSLVYYLSSEDIDKFDMSKSALISSIELHHAHIKNLIEELKEFYIRERNLSVENENRMSVPHILKTISNLITPD